MSKTIMLIHGAWLNAASWQGFKERYEKQGFKVVAPDWPLDDRSPKDLRERPNQALAHVSQLEIIDHYAREIAKLPEAPILIGHSLGGVFVQHLLDRGLGAVGVSINPAPTPGVPLGFQAILSALPVFIDPFSRGKLKFMSRSFFANRFAQTLDPIDVDAEYDRYIVPTSGRVYWDGIMAAAGKINWKSTRRPPLLLIGGEKDLIADASMTRAIFNKQKRAASPTELKIFPGRSHWTCLDRGWEEVADFALDWALAHQRNKPSLVAA